ncbi:MAG: FUSC family protein [Marmoricola sp.]
MSSPSHLDLALTRGRSSVSDRLRRLQAKSWQVAQCAVAAGVAWTVAIEVFGHQRPFFAPIAAVVSLGTGYGQRLRRVGEVTLGVAIGILLGDVLTQVIGSGGWQITLIVVLAMTTALLLDAGQIFVTQAAVQSIVVTTLLPDPNAAFTRWTDALIGGGVALVAATVVPRAPLRRPRRQAAVVVGKIAELLCAAADCIEDGDVEHAAGVLRDARSTDGLLRELQDAADEGLSVVASSPFRLRHRSGVRAMADLVEPMDFAMRNTRVLVRRVVVAAYRREPLPAGYAALTRDLASCAEEVAFELAVGRMAESARPGLIALGRASAGMERSSGLSGEVVLAQIRSIIADLLSVSGMAPFESTDQIPPLDLP